MSKSNFAQILILAIHEIVMYNVVEVLDKSYFLHGRQLSVYLVSHIGATLIRPS